MKTLRLLAIVALGGCAAPVVHEDPMTDAPVGTTVYDVETCLKELAAAKKPSEGAVDACFDKSIHVLKQSPTLRARTFYMKVLDLKYRDTMNHAWLMVGHYDQLFEETLRRDDLQSIDNPTLEALFDVTETLTVLSHDLTYAVDAENVYRELRRRRRELPSHLTRLYAIHLRTRILDRAQSIRNEFTDPPLPEVPEVESPEELDEMFPMYYRVSEDGKTLAVADASLPAGPRIEIVFDPTNERATRRLERILGKHGEALEKHGRLVTNQTEWRLDETVAWNRENPKHPLAIVYIQDHWDWLDSWKKPLELHFYLNQESRFQTTEPSKVAEGLKAIGL